MSNIEPFHKYVIVFNNDKVYPAYENSTTAYWGSSLDDAIERFNNDHNNCVCHEAKTRQLEMENLLCQ